VPEPAEVVAVVLDPAPFVTGVVEGVWVVLCPISVDVELLPDVDPPDVDDTV